MKKISRDDYTTNKLRPEAQNLHTLNQVVSNQQAESINQENRRICQKLMKVNPYYPTLDIVDHTDQLQRVSANISENARRSISTSNLRPHSSSHLRPQSSTSRSKFYRSKVSKYDQEGAATQEQFYKYFQVQSVQTLRPESALPSPSR